MNKEVMFSSKSEMWSTPQDFFDMLDYEFDFTLDACAVKENAKCKRYYTPEDDGLFQPWEGVVWCNPPYGRQIGKWVQKAYESAQGGEYGRNAYSRKNGYGMVPRLHFGESRNQVCSRKVEVWRK